MVIGIRSEGAIRGMTVIGPDRPTPALNGLGLVTTARCFMRATGRASAGASSTTIAGIATGTETFGVTGMVTGTIMTETIVAIATAANS
jgi:hypothetical protein